MKNNLNTILVILVLHIFCFLACSQETKHKNSIKSPRDTIEKAILPNVINTPKVVYGTNHLKVIIYEDNKKPKIKDGDYIMLNSRCETSDGKVIEDTYAKGTPTFDHMYPSYEKGDFNEAMRLLGEGDSAKFWIKDKLTETDSLGNVTHFKDENKHTIYRVKILKIWKRLPKESEEAFEKRKYDIFMSYHDKEK